MNSPSQGATPWTIVGGDGPVVCTAIHAGHSVRDDLKDLYALASEERLREEDPYTDLFIPPSNRFSRVVVHRSRFECDMNRPREKAVYRNPADAWGLQVWKEPPPDTVLNGSYRLHDLFYRDMDALIGTLLAIHNRTVVVDIHSYNHRRNGPDGLPAAVDTNPDYNIGTATMGDRDRWSDIIDVAMTTLASSNRCGAVPVVKENVRFRGGYLAEYLHTRHGGKVCVLSLEVKKFFMDEWTGEADGNCLNSTTEVVHHLADTLDRYMTSRKGGARR